jgi:hypothetical protein
MICFPKEILLRIVHLPGIGRALAITSALTALILALTSIGGLLSSTVLILLVLPALYFASVRVGWAVRAAWLWMTTLRLSAQLRVDSA